MTRTTTTPRTGILRTGAARLGLLGAVLASGAMLLGGCNNGFEGASSGAALGALAGLGLGSLSGDAGKGAAAGAIIGGLGGAILGDQNARNAQYNDPYRSGSGYGYRYETYSTRRSYAPTWYYDDDCRPYDPPRRSHGGDWRYHGHSRDW